MPPLPRLSACRSVLSKHIASGTDWLATARLQMSMPINARVAASRSIRYPAGSTSNSAHPLAAKHGGTRTNMRYAEKQSTPSLALTAARASRHTGTDTESIALTPVMLPLDSEVAYMSDEGFLREARYQASLSIAKVMLRRGLISREEFGKIDGFLLEKYHPPLGTLFVHGR